jgi:methyltransferase family protein
MSINTSTEVLIGLDTETLVLSMNYQHLPGVGRAAESPGCYYTWLLLWNVVSNPWLTVPLIDYERHMASPEVGQLRFLSDLFAESLASFHPRSVAVLGIAGGNGLERIDPRVTRRVVGFDVNPDYLDAIRERYPRLPSLELHCLDLADEPVHVAPVELVHAALVFEHAGTERCLKSALALVAPGGGFSAVLQLAGDPGQDVAATPFESVQRLRDHFSLVDPEWFQRAVERRGFSLLRQVRCLLPANKAFWMGLFERRNQSPSEDNN